MQQSQSPTKSITASSSIIMDKNLETCGVFDEERDKGSNEDRDREDYYEDEEDLSESSDMKGVNSASAGSAKEISAPYDMPHYPIEVEEHRKIVMPQLEQFAHKEFEERTKALPTVSSSSHLYLMDHPLHSEPVCDHSLPNSGIASQQLDTGSAGLTSPVTGVCKTEASFMNGGFDSGHRSPDGETDIDYVPHFQRVYITGSDCPLSGVRDISSGCPSSLMPPDSRRTIR